jgi:hypothetical protein
MRELSVPALIIQGEPDASIPIELSGLRQAELLPHSPLIIYRDAPNGLYLTHGGRLDHDLTRFIETNAVSTPDRARDQGGARHRHPRRAPALLAGRDGWDYLYPRVAMLGADGTRHDRRRRRCRRSPPAAGRRPRRSRRAQLWQP